MIVTENELCKLLEVPVEIDDRRQLLDEKVFSVDPDFVFTESQKIRRDAAATNLHPGFVAMARNLGSFSLVKTPFNIGPYFCGLQYPGSFLTEHAREVGQNIFGDWFTDRERFFTSSCYAVLFPDSPYLRLERKLSLLAGAPLGETRIDASLLDIGQLHEGGHSLFHASGGDGEFLADGFAISQFLRLGGDRDVVRVYIDARRLGAFSGRSLPEYATAMGCDALLEKRPVPNSYTAILSGYQLQNLVLTEMAGRRVTEASFEEFRKAFWNCSREEFLAFKDNVYSTFKKVSFPFVIDCLGRALDRADFISEGLRDEGEKTIAAYGNLMRLQIEPQDEALRPSGAGRGQDKRVSL
ncbi:MAG: hypothetical protein PHE27_04650 [Alphaproteobacteria bacterium]|nr:hypothetical protein [Alphaproteobacteria bacterium]